LFYLKGFVQTIREAIELLQTHNAPAVGLRSDDVEDETVAYR
jgi:hypothetical protein